VRLPAVHEAHDAIEGEPAPPHRYAALQATMARLHRDAGAIADRVRDDGSIEMPIWSGEADVRRGPLWVRDMAEHFTHSVDGSIRHSVFGYTDDRDLDDIDLGAQYQLRDILATVHELNHYCQTAEQQDALAVALHAPAFPGLLDPIIVGTAYFAAFFENLTVTQPFVQARPGDIVPFPDFPALKANFDRHLAMAQDRMLEPGACERYRPRQPWPHLGAELACIDHLGGTFVHDVYFPSADAFPAIRRIAGLHASRTVRDRP
jgi:hypothetical protein